MPSAATRRRRAGGGADVAAGELLEGGGSRGSVQHGGVDDERDTVRKLAAYRAQEAARASLTTRAHLLAFPLFLFALLALFSHALHLSFLACVLIPLLMGAALLGASLLAEKALGKSLLSSENGSPLIVLLVFLTLLGLALSQLVLRDKLGPNLL